MSIALESKQATEETRVLSIWMNQWTACKIPFVLWTSWLIQLYMCQWRFWVNRCEICQACFCFLAPPELETVILASGEFRHTNLNSQGYYSNNLNCLALAFMWILLPLLWVLVIWDWQGFDFQFALKPHCIADGLTYNFMGYAFAMHPIAAGLGYYLVGWGRRICSLLDMFHGDLYH
jgi:hypothetical protein